MIPQIWQEKTKKIDMYDFPLHVCTATQESNKTVTKQDTGTTQQQKNDQTSRCLAHVLTEQWRFQRRGAAPPSFERKPRPTWLRQTVYVALAIFLTPPAPYLKIWIRHCSYTIISNEISSLLGPVKFNPLWWIGKDSLGIGKSLICISA